MRIYVSGPMSGYPDLNVKAFEHAARGLNELGFEAVSPHEIPEPDGIDPEDVGPKVRAACLRADVAALAACDGIALIDGWRDSIGANVELWVARVLDLAVFTFAALDTFPDLSTANANLTLIGQHLADLEELNYAIV